MPSGAGKARLSSPSTVTALAVLVAEAADDRRRLRRPDALGDRNHVPASNGEANYTGRQPG